MPVVSPVVVYRRWLLPFVVLSAIWGSSFALIKIAVEGGVPPVWVAFLRCVFGATTLWVLVAIGRQTVPGERALWLHGGIAAVLLNSLPFTLIAYGEDRMSSVLAGVLNASTPLFTLCAVMLLLPGERPTWWRLVGLAVGAVGVAAVVDVSSGVEASDLRSGVAVLGAAACYGAGFGYTRRHLSGRPESGTVLATVQITLATLQLGVITPLTSRPLAWPGLRVALALVVLGALGTGLAYVLNFAVIRSAGATVASTVTYAVPLWSTALGSLLLAEPIGWHAVIGGLLIVSGVALSRHRGPTGPSNPVRADSPGIRG